jgi:hypothetical protein
LFAHTEFVVPEGLGRDAGVVLNFMTMP